MAVELADDAVGLGRRHTRRDLPRHRPRRRRRPVVGLRRGPPGLRLPGRARRRSPPRSSAAGITWIGPSADVIALMGDKLAARRTSPPTPACRSCPASTVASDDADAVAALGDELGWPIAVKAVHGGGGRGMRVIERTAATSPTPSTAARRESQSAVRPARRLRRALPRAAPPRRGPGRRRPPRRPRRRRRPRLLDPTALPEAHRGGAGSQPARRRFERRWREASIQLARAVGYTNAGTDRVPGRGRRASTSSR